MSLRAVVGRRREIGFSIGLWLFGTPLLAGLLTLPVSLLGRWWIPMLADRLGLLAMLQFHWLGEISRAERVRMRSWLEAV